MWVSSASAPSRGSPTSSFPDHLFHLSGRAIIFKSVVSQTKELVRLEKAFPFYGITFQSDGFARTVHCVFTQLRGPEERAERKKKQLAEDCLTWPESQFTWMAEVTRHLHFHLDFNNLPIKCKFFALSTAHLPLPSLTSSHSWMTTSSLLSPLASATLVSVLR